MLSSVRLSWLHVSVINALCARVLLSLQVTMALIRLLTRLSGYVHLKQGLECLGASSQSTRLQQHTAPHSSSCNYQLLPDCLGERHAFPDSCIPNRLIFTCYYRQSFECAELPRIILYLILNQIIIDRDNDQTRVILVN